MGRALPAVIAALLVATATGARAERVLIDSVAAVVDRRVFTWSEVEAEGRILLVNRVGQRALTAGMDTAFLDSVLDYLIVQELLVREARRRGFTAREQDVDKGVALFKLKLDSEADYVSFLADAHVDEDTIRSVVRRDLAIESLLEATIGDDGAPTDAMIAQVVSTRGDIALLDEGERRSAAERAIRALPRDARFALLIEALRATTEVRTVQRPTR